MEWLKFPVLRNEVGHGRLSQLRHSPIVFCSKWDLRWTWVTWYPVLVPGSWGCQAQKPTVQVPAASAPYESILFRYALCLLWSLRSKRQALVPLWSGFVLCSMEYGVHTVESTFKLHCLACLLSAETVDKWQANL